MLAVGITEQQIITVLSRRTMAQYGDSIIQIHYSITIIRHVMRLEQCKWVETLGTMSMVSMVISDK